MNAWNLLIHAEGLHGDRTAAATGSISFTWNDVGRRVRALAAHLRRAGVRPGDRVAILEHNSLPFLETTFAVAALGGVLVPLGTRFVAREWTTILKHAEVSALIARSDLAAEVLQLRKALPGLRTLLWIGAMSDAQPSYEDAVASEHSAFRATPAQGDSAAQLYYTSGTTGSPKGVVLTHDNVCWHALGTVAELQLSERDVWAHVAPMFHLADAWATLAITWVGGRHVFAARFVPGDVLDQFIAEGVTLTNLVPTMLQRLVAEPGSAERSYPSLRLLLSGGAPIAPAVVRAVIETFRVEYVQTYGLTETSPYLTLSLLTDALRALPDEESFHYRAKTGRPFALVQLRVVGADGSTVARDGVAVGEIQARGPTVTPGYWRDDEATGAAFVDGWFRTGDLATVDAAGFLDIVDRAKDVVLVGGETVYSTEVEAALYEHEALLEVAVYGVPHDDWGQEVRAAVVLRPGEAVTERDLEEHLSTRLAGFKRPRRFEFLDELPRTPSGKIRKAALRERARAGD